MRHRRGESVDKRDSGWEANSSIEIFSPWGGLETERSAASEPRAPSSGCGEEEPFEPWTSPTAGSEHWRLARADPARASIQAPPPGNGAVGSGGEKEGEEAEEEGEAAEEEEAEAAAEEEVEVADGDGASATGLDALVACFLVSFVQARQAIKNDLLF